MKYQKILISGKRCTGKTTLFWDLQKKLAWPTFSTSQFLRDFIYTHGISRGLKQVEDKSQEITQEIDQRTTSLLKANSPVIVETRAFGQIFDQFPDTLKILLVCDDQERIKRSSFRQTISLQKAKKRLFKKDKEWFEKMKSLYQRDDFFELKYYDLVIDTTSLVKKEVLNLVLKKLEKNN